MRRNHVADLLKQAEEAVIQAPFEGLPWSHLEIKKEAKPDYA